MIGGIWIAFFLAAILVTLNTIWFVTGRRRDVALALYTNQGIPAIARNLPVVSPVLSGVAWTLLILAAPAALRLPLSSIAAGAGREIALVAFGYALSAVSLTIILAYRPPHRLHPRWLIALKYARPSATLTDRVVLVVVAVPGLILGLGVFAFALLSFLGPR